MRQWMRLKPYAEVQGARKLIQLRQSLQRLQSLQRRQRLEGLQSLENLECPQRIPLVTTFQDYRTVPIPKDSVVYCDIPYKGTRGYGMRFDHEAFYEWAKRQTELVVISEFSMPQGFCEVFGRLHVSTLTATSCHRVTEKLFVPEHQVEEYYRRAESRNLFNYEDSL